MAEDKKHVVDANEKMAKSILARKDDEREWLTWGVFFGHQSGTWIFDKPPELVGVSSSKDSTMPVIVRGWTTDRSEPDHRGQLNPGESTTLKTWIRKVEIQGVGPTEIQFAFGSISTFN